MAQPRCARGASLLLFLVLSALQARTSSGQKDAVSGQADPCVAHTCPAGNSCIVEGGEARCLSRCAAVRCAAGTTCIITQDGAAACVPVCEATKCPKGTICSVNADFQPMCISACAALKCTANTTCVVNQAGQARCVPIPCADVKCRKYKYCDLTAAGAPRCLNPCAVNPCAAGYTCFPDPFPSGSSACTCISKCLLLTKRCSPGQKCVLQDGQAVCVNRIRGLLEA
ncbi:hypothetical protein ABPG75_010037 [Micractinium tetrahymenae]